MLNNTNYTLIKTDNVIFEVSPVKDQANSNNKNVSNVDLGLCEERLRFQYNISESKDLIIFKIDIKDLNQLTTYVQYEIYHPDDHHKLSLDVCKGLNINIYAPTYLSDEEVSLISNLKDSGINLYDSNSSFYNDLCTPYTSINGVDMLLSDRQNEIYRKYGNKDLCQNDCDLEDYDENTGKAKCICPTQTNETNLDLFHTLMQEKDKLQESFFNTISNSNFKVMKCYKMAIDLKTIWINIGRIIMTFISFFVFIALFSYFFYEKKKLEIFLTQILNQKFFASKTQKKDKRTKRNSDRKISKFCTKIEQKKSNSLRGKSDKTKSLISPSRREEQKHLNIHPKNLDKENNDNNFNLEKKRRAYSYHKKRALNMKFLNNNINGKKNNNTIGRTRLKKFPQTNKNITNVLNAGDKINKGSFKSKNNPDIKNLRRSISLNNKFARPKKEKINNLVMPPKKKPTFQIHDNKNNTLSSVDKTGTKQNIIFSNNIYIKLNNKPRTKNKKNNFGIKNSKDSFLSSKFNLNRIYKPFRIKEKQEFKQNKITNFTSQELNTMEYKQALIYDNRTFFQFYWSLVKQKQIIFFVLFNEDYNLVTVKAILFFLNFSLYFTLNGFFFNDKTMHKLYKNNGSFDFIVQIPIICYSTMTTIVINIILKSLSLSDKDLIEIKQEPSLKAAKSKSTRNFPCLKLRIFIFFVLSFFLVLFFWYFISCFCAVYTNTQIILIKDTLVSFGISMVYPFGIYFVPGMLRIPALKSKSKDKECLYKASVLISFV